MSATATSTVQFSRLQEATREDITMMTAAYNEMLTPEILTNRLIDMLKAQKGAFGGAKIDLLEHGLQTATRAYHDGADEETIVCALFHDIGALLSPSNHGSIPAGILRPYISEKSWWILDHHEIFQAYYYMHFLGGDNNKRDQFKNNPYYKATVDFCESWDAPSFDPEYNSEDLEFFRPMVIRIFSKVAFNNDPTNPKAALDVWENKNKLHTV